MFSKCVWMHGNAISTYYDDYENRWDAMRNQCACQSRYHIDIAQDVHPLHATPKWPYYISKDHHFPDSILEVPSQIGLRGFSRRHKGGE